MGNGITVASEGTVVAPVAIQSCSEGFVMKYSQSMTTLMSFWTAVKCDILDSLHILQIHSDRTCGHSHDIYLQPDQLHSLCLSLVQLTCMNTQR